MKNVVIVGAGQLGVTFCLFFKRWLEWSGKQTIKVTLIDQAPEILTGSSTATWIDHATGFEYFNRGEAETGFTCIQGSILKRLLLPGGLLDLPFSIRNRFFVSKKSHEIGTVTFGGFIEAAQLARQKYQSLYDAVKDDEEAGKSLAKPEKFFSRLPEEEYFGVDPGVIEGAVKSAGGVANVPMEVAFKRSAFREIGNNIVEWVPNASISHIEERAGDVRLTVEKQSGASSIDADYVYFCAAHGNYDYAKLVQKDLAGEFSLNFMVHAHLPPTADRTLQDNLASVNFVLQGKHGGMYACILPPTDLEPGLAAMFAPGNEASYIDESATKDSLKDWNTKIKTSDFESRKEKIQAVLERMYEINPFLESYLANVPHEKHKVAVGSVFNSQRGNRAVRRLGPPVPLTSSGRMLSMTSPKWTTSELAALTLLHEILSKCSPNAFFTQLGEDKGFGPYNLDVLSRIAELKLENKPFDRNLAQAHLDSLDLPSRILPSHSRHFL
jgi:hypothetical protein